MGYESITHGTHLNFVLLIMFTRNLQAGKNKHISLLHVVVRQKTSHNSRHEPVISAQEVYKVILTMIRFIPSLSTMKTLQPSSDAISINLLTNFGSVLLDQRPMV